jgi:hypothetical protein
MRNTFRWFYAPTSAEFEELWSNAIFAFDANFLLNVYRYTPKTQQQMLSILERLGDRVWIPHQAALEFHRNRHRVIADQVAAYQEAKKAITESFGSLKGQLSRFARHPFIDCRKIDEALRETEERLVAKLDADSRVHPDLGESDSLRERLTEILGDAKIGAPINSEKRKELLAQGEQRYKQEIPPGFKDNKKEQPYGDWFVWRQLMDRATEKKQPIIFTTDDRKEDWWLRQQGKTIGPRPELIQEMFETTGQMFHMYVSDHFVELAAKRLDVEGSDEAVREVRTVREQDERQAPMSALQVATGVDPNLVLGRPGRPIEGTVSGSLGSASMRGVGVVEELPRPQFQEPIGERSEQLAMTPEVKGNEKE